MRKPDSKKADLRGADAAVLKILALQSGDKLDPIVAGIDGRGISR